MANEYEVVEPGHLSGEGVRIAVAGAVFVLFLGSASQWLVGLAVLAGIWLLGLAYVAEQVQLVRVTSDGMVEFVRLRGVRRVPAGSIRAIEGRMARDEDGDVFWRIRVRLARGRIELRCFGEAAAFVADIRRLNPAVAVLGKWPPSLAAPDAPLLGLALPDDPGGPVQPPHGVHG